MKVELRRDLEQVVARMLVPKVNRLTEAVARQARVNAPDAKAWVSMRDDRVRPTHRAADGQVIPDNLRFRVPKRVGSGVSLTQWDLAREPRDEELPAHQRDLCRCESVPVPGVVARAVRTQGAVIEGTRVRGRVEVEFTRIAESEFGTSRDPGSRFMRRALDEVAARVRGSSRRSRGR